MEEIDSWKTRKLKRCNNNQQPEHLEMKVDGGIQSSTFLHSGKMTKTLSLCLSPEKYLLMLQSIKRAVHIEPNNPWLHQCLVRFFKGGKCDLL